MYAENKILTWIKFLYFLFERYLLLPQIEARFQYLQFFLAIALDRHIRS